MPLKIAISGKGGVGKTTVAAALALLMKQRGTRVLAVDADPDANLASCLGVPREAQKSIVTIGTHRKLIEERTGAKVRQYGQMFTLNPEVSDIADTFAYDAAGVSLLVLGAVAQGGGGCACPENVILRALVSELVLHRNETLILDMEAGIEHLGRGTAEGVDTMLLVTEPGQRSIDSTRRVIERAAQIGLQDLRLVINKVMTPDDDQLVRQAFGHIPIVASIPFSADVRAGDRDGRTVLDNLPKDITDIFEDLLASVSVSGAVQH